MSTPDVIPMSMVEEGAGLPVTVLTASSDTLQPKRFGLIFVFDDRTLKAPAPGLRRQFDMAITSGLARGLDAAFVEDLFAAATLATGGLPGLIGAMPGAVRPVFITSLAALSTLATTTPPAVALDAATVFGQPTIITPAAGLRVLLIDVSKLALHADRIELDPASASAIQMDTAPTMHSGVPTGVAGLVSMFQTNSVALRGTAFLSWLMTTDGALQYITVAP
jgi:hypothetical protein